MQYKDLAPDELSHRPSFDNHEIVRRFELTDGIIAYVAVHNTNLGPSLGGCRIYPYASEDEALYDVLRLSRGMTYKNAMAGLPLGGGKSVIIANPKAQKTEELMKDFGRGVASLEGKYITAEDSGTSEDDMEAIRTQTPHVSGLHPETLGAEGYADIGGNPSPYTALGCFHGIKSAYKFKEGHDDLNGLAAAIQGVGAVGFALAKLLHGAGVKLMIADVSSENLQRANEEFGDVTIVDPGEIYAQDVDVFVPCAMGAVLNDDTIPQIKASYVAGPSNNQLKEEYHAKALQDLGITYVPDYIINAGGVICVGYEYFMTGNYNPYDFTISKPAMTAHIMQSSEVVEEILGYARDYNLTTAEAADRLAEEKFLK